jgi:hypothetical protein
MPYVSDAQRRFFHSPGAAKAGLTKTDVEHWDDASRGQKGLPEHVAKKKYAAFANEVCEILAEKTAVSPSWIYGMIEKAENVPKSVEEWGRLRGLQRLAGERAARLSGQLSSIGENPLLERMTEVAEAHRAALLNLADPGIGPSGLRRAESVLGEQHARPLVNPITGQKDKIGSLQKTADTELLAYAKHRLGANVSFADELLEILAEKSAALEKVAIEYAAPFARFQYSRDVKEGVGKAEHKAKKVVRAVNWLYGSPQQGPDFVERMHESE